MFASCRFGRVVSCIKEALDDVVRRRPFESPVYGKPFVAKFNLRYICSIL